MAKRDAVSAVKESARQALERGLAVMDSDPERALSEFVASVEESPDYYVAHYNSAIMYTRLGRLEEARVAFQASLQANPEFTGAALGLVGLLQRRGDVVGAFSFLDSQIAAHPTAFDLRATRAQMLAYAGKLAEAKEVAISVLRGDERNAKAMAALGTIYRKKKMYELSKLALNQAIEINPSLGMAYSELGLVFLEMGEKSQTVHALEKAVDANPYNPAILNNLGVLRSDVGAFKTAVEVMQQAVKLAPDRPEYYLNLGNAFRGDQRYAKAEWAYKRALEIGSGSPDALFNLGILYLDNELPGKDTLERYRACIDLLRTYATRVKITDEDRRRISEYLETAHRAIESEEKRRERQERRRQREMEKRQEGETEPRADATSVLE